VRRRLEGTFELDDDPGRIDLDEVHRFLSQESYWAKGRPRDVQAEMNSRASRLVGLYDGERQIGFARTSRVEGMPVAYLYDVYVLPEYRGRGLGEELVRETVDRGPFAGHRWLLDTDDAHDFYEKFGFRPPSRRLMERPRK
jgi:GNAT superfamily N-acetyltransferase